MGETKQARCPLLLTTALFHLSASGRNPTASQSSGCYDSDSLELPRPEDTTPEDSGPGGLGSRAQAANGSSERVQPPRSSGLRRQAIQNWQRRPRRHSTEGEEGDVSDVGSRTTESEAEGPSEAPRSGPAVSGPLSSRLSGEPREGGAVGRGPFLSRDTQIETILVLGSAFPFWLHGALLTWQDLLNGHRAGSVAHRRVAEGWLWILRACPHIDPAPPCPHPACFFLSLFPASHPAMPSPRSLFSPT